ncbi:hypothetical protein H6F86_01120 [Phormidium sp. FACHB-592]|uniref:Uncharacterized protein n=1 Tax=Stenomitos frigidus AS-A4 TaxID=2933935 RepID=A0ABV0KQF5_9CYAN|nr:hypothetical protein [Phormidium sp. FACHB-592]MBD2072536.1 hypothetical protein [Phormidium sp. FACHB-592]
MPSSRPLSFSLAVEAVCKPQDGHTESSSNPGKHQAKPSLLLSLLATLALVLSSTTVAVQAFQPL